MNNYVAILEELSVKLLKALDHLDYSYNKVLKLPEDLSKMDDEELETWESFSSRFSRVSDIFIMQYLRARIALVEPGFKGSTRDYLNKAEKFGVIESAVQWTTIRELRNAEAHEYNDTDLSEFYKKIRSLCPVLLEIRKTIAGLSDASY